MIRTQRRSDGRVGMQTEQSKNPQINLGIAQSSKIHIKVSKDGRSITIDSKEGVITSHLVERKK